ncbi:MAG: chalcone isomerase family protein [Thermodesulfobacteriota bacterium]|nr:chalcone isomerase family protein [Thermodesulfobacteriota bacterium]
MKRNKKMGLFTKPSTLVLAAFFATLPVFSATIENTSFAPDVTVNGKRLTLRGVSLLRHLVFIKAYTGAFYLAAGEPAAEALGDVERRLVLHYFHAIPAREFADATTQMIEKNVSPDQYRQLMPHIREMNGLYRDVKPGDRYIATFIPGTGTQLSLNDQLLGTVANSDFAAAFFSIWIGDHPIDKGFRDDLLNGSRLPSEQE